MKKFVLAAMMVMFIVISVVQADVTLPDEIKDDSFSSVFSVSGEGWVQGAVSLTPSFHQNCSYVLYDSESATQTATWAFDDVADGTYVIYAMWYGSEQYGAEHGVFSLSDGGTGSSVDFRVDTAHDIQITDGLSVDQWFQEIGKVTVTDGTVSVVLGFSSEQSADKAILADAVALVRKPTDTFLTIDDGEVAVYSDQGDWIEASSLVPDYNNNNRYISYGSAGENSEATATWAFAGVPDGTYVVYGMWSECGVTKTHGAKHGVFTLSDGGTGSPVDFTEDVAQDIQITDDQSVDQWFQKIGLVTVADGTVDVTLGFSSEQSDDKAILADAVALVRSENMLVNPGFEDGMMGWVFSFGGGCEITGHISDQISFAGSKSLYLRNQSPKAGGVYGRIFQDVSVMPNTRYRMSCRVKTVNAYDLFLGNGYDDWTLRKYMPPSTINTFGEWELAVFEFVTEPDETEFRFQLVSENCADDIWVDEFSLIKISDPAVVRSAADIEVDFASLEASISTLESLRDACNANDISTDYEDVQIAIINDFIDYGREDIAHNFVWRADYVAVELSKLYEEAEENLTLYDDGTKESLPVPRFKTGEYTIKDYGFEAELEYPVTGESEIRPLFFNGYGHFNQVKYDIPKFRSLGANLIQIDIGPDHVVKEHQIGGVHYSIDNDTVGFSFTGTWSPIVSGLDPDFNGESRYTYTDDDIYATALWSFSNLADGIYDVYAMWPTGEWDGANGDFVISDGGGTHVQDFDNAPVQDLQIPDASTSQWFQKIGTVTVTDSNVSVTLSFSSGQGGTSAAIVADAVALVRIPFIDISAINGIANTLQYAEDHNISVCLLTSMHYFPEWATNRWPELAAYPIQGFMRCAIDSPKADLIFKAFLDALIPAVKDYESLHSICLANEPTYQDSSRDGYTQTMWCDYLEKEHVTIQNLNTIYQSSHTAFGDVPIPEFNRILEEAPVNYDWCRFNMDRFADWHQWLANCVHDHAPNLPVHVKMMPTVLNEGGGVLDGNDPYSFCDLSDMNGCDAHEYYEPWYEHGFYKMRFYDLLRSMTNAPVINTEDHVIRDFDIRYIPEIAKFIRSDLWNGAVHGRSGSVLWNWDREYTYDTSTIRSTSILNRPDCVNAAGKTFLDMNRLAYEVKALQDAPAKVAIFFSIPSIVYCKEHLAAQRACYPLLQYKGLKTDFITEEQVMEGKLDDYDVVIVPGAGNCYAATRAVFEEYDRSPGQIILVGADCLEADEYDRTHSPVPQLPNAVSLPFINNPVQMGALLSPYVAGLNSITLTDATTGQPAWGVAWLAAEKDGTTWLSFTNYSKKNMSVIIKKNGQTVGSFKDLFSDTQINGSELQANVLEPVFVEF